MSKIILARHLRRKGTGGGGVAMWQSVISPALRCIEKAVVDKN